jgi:hypothetical protein
MKPIVRRAIALWIPSLMIAGVLALPVDVAVQQNYRNNANDPQLQMAQDAAAGLSSGSITPAQLTAGPKVNIATSLAPYTEVLDSTGKPVAGTATLDGSVPVPPQGVLDNATANGIDTITWQPRSDVRQAIVVVPYSGTGGTGTVVVGRSLTEIETRESQLLLMAALALIVAIGASAVGALFGAWIWERTSPPPPAAVAEVPRAA